MEKEKLQMMFSIAQRAEEKGLLYFDRLSLFMDLKLASKIFDLKLEKLLTSDDSNFKHDILGIQENMDRRNKQFKSDFLPRFC